MREYLTVLGRALWIVLAANGVLAFALMEWITLQLFRYPSSHFVPGLSETAMSSAVYRGFFVISTTLVLLTYLVVALLIFLRRPNDGFAQFSAVFLLNFGIAIAYPDLLEFIQYSRNSLSWYAIPLFVSIMISWTSLFAFFVLYPDGRFVPRWSVIVAVAGFFFTAAWGLFPEAFEAQTGPVGAFGALGAVALTGAGLYVQAWRYRYYYSPTQRQQAKWFVFALAIFLVSTALYFALSIAFERHPTSSYNPFGDVVAMVTGKLSAVLIPIAIGLAILRYRLWDIDIVIRKTLVYTVLTGLLALLYFGSVVLLQRLVGAVTGIEQSTLAVVVSTLVIAALFTPLRRRIQNAIDRRFFRKKYDAQQVLAQFALTARDETDLDALTAELARVVDETLQPEHVSVWLRTQ